MDRLTLYDAALSMDGEPSLAYLDRVDEAIRAGDLARALAIVAGVNAHSAASKLPLAVQTAICRAFLRTPIGRKMGGLLPMTLFETRQILAYEGPAEPIKAEVLLARGASGPPYFARHNEALARVLPRARTLIIPRSRHDAIAVARPRLVEPIAAFFSTPVAPERADRV